MGDKLNHVPAGSISTKNNITSNKFKDFPLNRK